VFLEYLMAERSSLMDHWAEGSISLANYEARSAEAKLYKRIAELPFEDIEFLYSK
jgi:hypothetical protein